MNGLVPLHAGMIGECEVNGRRIDCIVLVGTKPAIMTWARAGLFNKHMLPIVVNVGPPWDEQCSALDSLFRDLAVEDGEVTQKVVLAETVKREREVTRHVLTWLDHLKLIEAVRGGHGRILCWRCTDSGVAELIKWRSREKEAKEAVSP